MLDWGISIRIRISHEAQFKTIQEITWPVEKLGGSMYNSYNDQCPCTRPEYVGESGPKVQM